MQGHDAHNTEPNHHEGAVLRWLEDVASMFAGQRVSIPRTLILCVLTAAGALVPLIVELVRHF